MCDIKEQPDKNSCTDTKIVPVNEAVGTVLSHDITEIRPGEFKGRAFKKGHIIREEDIEHLQRLGKENIYILQLKDDEMHENDAACALARALAGKGVAIAGEPNEGKINLVAEKGGLLKINREALLNFNMLGDVMCATIHNNSVVKEKQVIAGTRAIPLVLKRKIVEEAVKIADSAGGILRVEEIRKAKAGVVITGNEVYYGKIKDAFEPVIRKKVKALHGDIVGVYFAPDDTKFIEDRIRELIDGGADIIITSGGMSVDPDDVTRFAIRNLGCEEMYYGSPVLPGAMFLVAYYDQVKSQESGVKRKKSSLSGIPDSDLTTHNSHPIPILGIPACGMYADTTVFDLILPRILAGEKIGRKELAQLGHGGLCLKCETCRYPVCPFGK